MIFMLIIERTGGETLDLSLRIELLQRFNSPVIKYYPRRMSVRVDIVALPLNDRETPSPQS
jgi:hypothetical protein